MPNLARLTMFHQKLINKNLSIMLDFRRKHWNKDHKPGPFPKSGSEYEAAAQKYQLLPKEYQPYVDDGLGYGDYPKLPDIGVEMKDNFYPYDFPELKRNLNEPLHAESDLFSEVRYSQPAPLRYPMYICVGSFLAVLTTFAGLYLFLEDKKMFRPAKPKQYPTEGTTQYTFMPES